MQLLSRSNLVLIILSFLSLVLTKSDDKILIECLDRKVKIKQKKVPSFIEFPIANIIEKELQYLKELGNFSFINKRIN
jgi:hypothetical protein